MIHAFSPLEITYVEHVFMFAFVFPCMTINVVVYTHNVDKACSEVKRHRYVVVLQG